MDKLLGGVIEFHHYRAPRLRPEFHRLVVEGQRPRALMVTCADSRVVPTLFTMADPGDLFKVRNIGNLVPPCGEDGLPADRSVPAAVEYALSVLQVPNIIVCGHSDCGAMKAVLNFDSLPQQSVIRDWLDPAAEAERRDEHLALELSGDEPAHDQLAKRNVLRQLNNLRGYAPVKQALEAGRVRLHGWFFDVDKAELQVYHPTRMQFVAVDEHTAEEMRFLQQVFQPPVSEEAAEPAA